ncbi:MAG TPA: ATP-binding protein [Hanamia sp.]|nr:ATP-binding protein [Hanamia sp.]
MLSEPGLEKSGTFRWLEPFEDFLENSPEGIHLLDENGIILFANKAELRMLGYTKEEYVGHHVSEFHIDPSTVEFNPGRFSINENVINLETRLKCKDGSVKDVLTSCNAYFEESTFKRLRCFSRDITHLKRSENLLRFLNHAGEELYASHDTKEALDKTIKLIVPHFADWVVINELRADGFAHLLKMAHADPGKVKWAEKYRESHPVDLNERRGSLGWAMRTGEAVLYSEINDSNIEEGAMDDEQKEILRQLSIQSVMIVPMKIKGRVSGVISFISCNPQNKYNESDFSFAKDFTNRIALTLENTRLYEEVKKDIEERIEIDKKKDEFISIASHELKTPVTSLKAYTQILQTTFDEDKNEKASAMFAKMDKQIDKLTGLIVDLLDVTKIDKGEMIFDFEKFDVNELITEIAEEMQRTAPKHKIKLKLSDCKKIKGDRNRIGQVIVNFISNAIKYSPGKDKIIVSSKCDDNDVIISVKDFGIGIPKTEHHHIFKRFYRVSGKNNYTFPGLGLGLYISSEIIKRHRGEISFQSKEGKGSTFYFEIPLRGNKK